MLLTIETTHQPAADLGYLLHKHPSRVQTFSLSYGAAHVFYPCAEDDCCRVALLLDIDTIGLVRNPRNCAGARRTLDHYINDRPYVASSFLSVAIGQVFSSAMNGKCAARPELVSQALPLTATLAVVPCRGGADLLKRLFEPLGYRVSATPHVLDPAFPDWGASPYFTLTLENTLPLQALLQHLYVLIPVLDNDKHYWVGADEVEKLLARASEWLPTHPEKELITRRYLKYDFRLTRDALARLAPDEEPDPDAAEAAHDQEEAEIEQPLSLNAQRIGSVLAVLKSAGATSVVDLGCGEGNLLRELLREKQFSRILGVDVSIQALSRAASKLKLERLPPKQRERIELRQSSLIYRDEALRLADGQPYDAATLVEVIEHLDPPRLHALERAVFEFAQPRTAVVTTPNREYNVRWETLPAGAMRHRDHRFEWTRAEFQAWAQRVAATHDYTVRFLPVGPEDAEVGSPTQMGVFLR